jgi:uncharacterized protein involved in cysteine biosynthesis
MAVSLDSALTLGRALALAGRDLLRGDILWQALWPPLVSFLAWSGVALAAWMPLSRWLLGELPGWSWLDWLGPWLVHVVLFLCFAPLIYLTTLLLVTTFALPRMMSIVAARDYPDLVRHGPPGAAVWGSLGNTLLAGLIFIAGWLLSLPLLLIPGALLVLPLFWGAWLNQRSFRFDVLAEHATVTERTRVIRDEKSRFWSAGLVTALMAHVPLINLLAPAYAALLFVHLGLSALRGLREKEGVWVSGH